MKFVPIPLSFLLAIHAGAGLAPARQTANPPPGSWQTVPLPVATHAVTEAAGLPSSSTPESLLFDLIRVLHDRPIVAAEAARGPLGRVLGVLSGETAPDPASPPTLASDVIPTPLSTALWSEVIFQRPTEPAHLAEAILADRRASLVYVGLSRMDAGTVAALAERPALLRTLYEKHAAALAAFGGSLVIRGAAVRPPGADLARAAWELLVGASVSDPETFLPALLERDHGRLAYLYDAVSRLDEPHRGFVLGSPEARARLRDLYEVFRRANPEWDVTLVPFHRPPLDPASALRALRVTPEGRLAPPSSRRLWDRVLGGATGPSGSVSQADGADADAAGMVDQVLSGGPKRASGRLARVQFAQRAFESLASVATPADPRGGLSADQEDALVAALEGLDRFPALMLTLERLGVTQPDVYRRAAQVAGAVSRRADTASGQAVLGVLQGMLALVGHAAWSGTIEPAEARRLVGSLLALEPTSDGYAGRVIDWLALTLVPAFTRATGSLAGDDPGLVVLRSLAGVRVPMADSERPLIAWEGQRYRVDPAAALLARHRRWRDRQGPPTLADLLALHRQIVALGREPARRELIAGASASLDAIVSALPDFVDNRALRGALDEARGRIAGSARRVGPGVDRRLIAAVARARTAVAADVLTALAYLPHLGDPLGPARLGGDVARRHAWSAQPADDHTDPPWAVPSEVVTPERGWHVEGALLGLDSALARLSLQRLDLDIVPSEPRLDAPTRHRLALDVARTRPCDLTDEDQARLAGAVHAGQARIERLPRDPSALPDVAVALRLEPRRVQALRWILANGMNRVVTRFSMGELARLGAGDPLPWVFQTMPGEACPKGTPGCPRELSDLAVRLVTGLADRHLPATLLPFILGAATQDFIDAAQPAHDEDRAALTEFVDELPEERLDDYIAALVGAGPLAPVEPSRGAGGRR